MVIFKVKPKGSVSFSNAPPQVAPAGLSPPPPAPAAAPASNVPIPRTTAAASPPPAFGAVKLKLTGIKRPPSTSLDDGDPAVPKAKRPKPARARKPSKKFLEGLHDDEDAEETETLAAQVKPQRSFSIKNLKLRTHTGSNGSLKLSATSSTTPRLANIKLKTKGAPPKRPVGDGYDSCASDREEDPAIEEELILRLPPGEDAEYVRSSIIDKKLGLSVQQGGADVSLRFFDAEGRHAAVHVRDKVYAATVVDLPCIIEGMKSWDKRGWWKAADIAQMLLAHTLVRNDAEARTCPLPSEVDPKTHQYPHGITPPMHYARRRRFRKRLRLDDIVAIEDEVERLMQEDAKAMSTSAVVVDYEDALAEQDQLDALQVEADGEEDAEGEDDLFEQIDGDAEDDDTGYLYAETPQEYELDEDEAALAAELEEFNADDTAMSTAAATPSQLPETPAAETTEAEGNDEEEEEEEEEDSGDESEEDGDEAPEVDPAELARIQMTKDDIAELEGKVRFEQTKLAQNRNPHPMIKLKVDELVRKYKQEIQLKKAAIGLDDED